MGRAGLVPTQLYTDHDHTDPDRPGGAATAAGPRGGETRAERHHARSGIDVYGPLQYISGGDDTGGHELQRRRAAARHHPRLVDGADRDGSGDHRDRVALLDDEAGGRVSRRQCQAGK